MDRDLVAACINIKSPGVRDLNAHRGPGTERPVGSCNAGPSEVQTNSASQRCPDLERATMGALQTN